MAAGTDPPPASRPRVALIVLWASFLSACAASACFFAVFDPARLGAASEQSFDLSRPAGYAVGFFFFWAVGALSGAIVTVLGKRRRR